MQIEVVKSKIHRVKITQADLNYIGSITIDERLMEASNIIEGEKVQVVNINNGERLETYAIKGVIRQWRGLYEWSCCQKSSARRSGHHYHICKYECSGR